MFTKEQLDKFNGVVLDVLSQPTLGLRQNLLDKYYDKHAKMFDFFISLALEVQSVNVTTTKNSKNFCTFERELGEVVYVILNNTDKAVIARLLNPIFQTIYYPLQQILFNFLNKQFIKKLTEVYLLEKLGKYYKLSEIISNIELPNIIENVGSLPLQSLSREDITEVRFPLTIHNIPKKYKYNSLNYFVKKDGQVTSNIQSSVIRKELDTLVPYSSYGVIGVTLTLPKYKNKKVFQLLYFNQAPSNILKMYKNSSAYNNQLDSAEDFFKFSDIILINKGVKVDTEDELIDVFTKHKVNNKKVIFTQSQVDVFKTNVEYVYASVLDYIYNDEFEAIGLVIRYNNQEFKIKFNISNTVYIKSIKNAFVRVQVIKYLDKVLSVKYNSQVVEWFNEYPYCILCKSVDYKHKSKGVCHKCYNKLYRISEELSEEMSFELSENVFKEASFIMNQVSVVLKGNEVSFKPLSGKQLSLPLNQEVSLF